jgi:hypothetical protein
MTISVSRLRHFTQMLILRWLLGSLSALALALSLYILLIERDYEFFRPLGVFLLLPLLLASTLLPGATKLFHLTALCTLAVFIYLLPQILLQLDNSIAAGFLGLWLIFYWLHVWHAAGFTYFGYAIFTAAFIATLIFGKDFNTAPAGSFQRAIAALLLAHSVAGLAIGGACIYFGRVRS